MHRTSRQVIKMDGKDWIVHTNHRSGPGEFDADIHCDMCDPTKKKFFPKLIEVGNRTVCGHCLMIMTKVLNESTIIDCKKGDRH